MNPALLVYLCLSMCTSHTTQPHTLHIQFTISEHGCVTIKEVGMVLIVLGEYISSYTILDMMKEMGLDENSFIKFNDFLEVYLFYRYYYFYLHMTACNN